VVRRVRLGVSVRHRISGGTFDNRARFLVEVVRATRRHWPEGRPLFVRLSTTDWLGADGWDIEDSIALARRLRPEGVDVIDCSSGGIAPQIAIDAGPGYQTTRRSMFCTGQADLVLGCDQENRGLGGSGSGRPAAGRGRRRVRRSASRPTSAPQIDVHVEREPTEQPHPEASVADCARWSAPASGSVAASAPVPPASSAGDESGPGPSRPGAAASLAGSGTDTASPPPALASLAASGPTASAARPSVAPASFVPASGGVPPPRIEWMNDANGDTRTDAPCNVQNKLRLGSSRL
jgi:hypothetical protein